MKKFDRRTFIKASAVALASQSLLSSTIFAENRFSLPALPYDPAALEPSIDQETMRIHHGKHHQTYVDKLNEQMTKDPSLSTLSLEQINSSVSRFSEAVRNNAGGHFNHTFFWNTMAPVGKTGEPSAELKKVVDATFGGIDQMKEALNAAALSRFGSGWGWLILGSDKKLQIATTPYQDNPTMDAASVKGTPLIAIDVWEHAYYLKYQNRRADYLKNWWTIAHWSEINKRFASAFHAS